MIEIAEDAIAFSNARFGNFPADGVQPGVIEQASIAIPARLPDRPMPGRDGKVGAGQTGAFGSQHRVRSPLVAEAGSGFDTVDAITPVTDPEPEVGLLHKEADIGLDIAVTRASPELRASGNHPPALAAKRCRRQHLFEGGARFLLSMAIDKIVESEVGPNITAIGHRTGDMTEVRLKRMQAGPVALADEAGEGLSALMRVQMPGLTLMMRRAMNGANWLFNRDMIVETTGKLIRAAGPIRPLLAIARKRSRRPLWARKRADTRSMTRMARSIALLKVQGHSIQEIGRRLGRAASTVSRELRRNAATRGGGLGQ